MNHFRGDESSYAGAGGWTAGSATASGTGCSAACGSTVSGSASSTGKTSDGACASSAAASASGCSSRGTFSSASICVYFVKIRKTAVMPLDRIESTTSKYPAKRNTEKITTAVVPCTCLRFGQVTRRISSFSSLMYSFVRSNQFFASSAINLLLPTVCGVVGRGGGIRTPTRGFGDRWSAVKPTPLGHTPGYGGPPSFYLISLWGWCFRQCGQNFFSSRRSVVVFLFLVEE